MKLKTCWLLIPRCPAYTPGPWFNIKMSYYQYKKSHYGDKTVLRPSYLHNGISYTGKMTALYWTGALYISARVWARHKCQLGCYVMYISRGRPAWPATPHYPPIHLPGPPRPSPRRASGLCPQLPATTWGRGPSEVRGLIEGRVVSLEQRTNGISIHRSQGVLGIFLPRY